MTANKIILGNFADLIIGGWGALDLTTDKSNAIKSGGAEIVAMQDFDIGVRNPESFCVGTIS